VLSPCVRGLLHLRYCWLLSILYIKRNGERFSRPFRAPRWITTATSTCYEQVYVPVAYSTLFTFSWQLLTSCLMKCVNGARFKILYTNFTQLSMALRMQPGEIYSSPCLLHFLVKRIVTESRYRRDLDEHVSLIIRRKDT
jgi:hypothetical protein